MFQKAVFPGKYIQGQGALKDLPTMVDAMGSKGMILASPTVKEKVIPQFGSAEITERILVTPFGGECCENEIGRVIKLISENHIDVLIGMGGGKTIDTAKIAANRAGIPVIIVPTIAASDAPCSGCAVIYTDDGIFAGVDYQKMNPAAVLVDLDIIAAAPTRFLVAGMGDALATWFEARSCSQTGSMNECGGLSTMTGLNLARLCFDTLMKYGVEAMNSSAQHMVTPALSYITEANILLSGIGFESSGLAAAHAIHNGLTALNETHAFYHGEKVAFGVLAGLQLTNAPMDEVESVYSFCTDVGLPTTLEDIGLKNATRGMLLSAAEKACAPGEAIHHEAGRITPDKVLEAIIKADELGKARKLR